MSNFIIHNPRCSKSREALRILEEKKQDFEIISYLNEPLSNKDLKSLFKTLNLTPYEGVRKKEKLFKELELSKVDPDDHEAWFSLLEKYPILIERPIVSLSGQALIARPPERVLELL